MADRGRLVIFTEGDLVRGLGHVSRCSAYAEAWRADGGEVLWVLDGDEAARAMAGVGADVRLVAWQRDLGDLLDGLPHGVALVDSYAAIGAVHVRIADWAEAVIFIDDLETDYPRGLVVHPAPGLALTDKASAAVWLIGPAWQPLRPAFWNLAPRPLARDRIERLLVLMGGGDLRGLGGLLASLASEVCPGAEIDLVLPVGQAATAVDGPVAIHCGLGAAAMADLMSRADVAVSGAGQTLFELARCGTPTVMVGLADNQHPNLDHWPALCGFVSAGQWDQPPLDDRVRAGLEDLAPARRRQDIADRASALVDGQGVRRLFDYLDQARRA